MEAEPYRQSQGDGRDSRPRREWWSFEWEAFDGEWILHDVLADDHAIRDTDRFIEPVLDFTLSPDAAVEACGETADPELLKSLARLLVVRVVGSAIRHRQRAEDLHDDVAESMEYLAELELPPYEQLALLRLLGALVPLQPERVAQALLLVAWLAQREGKAGSARSLAELAYDAGLMYEGSPASAQGAALALSRLAVMDECPVIARRWRRIASLHGRQEARRVMLRRWQDRIRVRSA